MYVWPRPLRRGCAARHAGSGSAAAVRSARAAWRLPGGGEGCGGEEGPAGRGVRSAHLSLFTSLLWPRRKLEELSVDEFLADGFESEPDSGSEEEEARPAARGRKPRPQAAVR